MLACVCALACALAPGLARAGDAWVRTVAAKGDFTLFRERAAPLVYGAGDAAVVGLAVRDLAVDIDRVAGRKPRVATSASGARGEIVLVGTLGHNPAIDALVANGKLDVAALRGAWESFVIATVEAPMAGVARALVIVGSDARGTAFGVYELSQAIGVSPWTWWADVAPAKKAALFVAAGTRRFGPPSVKYRGIFINDEDWGLQPWAAKTYEPENGGIGPKTYARVFELLLRLKANTLWPAMHACTRPFNSFAQNARLANDYAIVMGSSHAEPMLRNNVGEWTAAPGDYNYLSNPDGVRAYWDERLATNGGFENIYTLGMRGIHDSNMQGPKTDAERIATLQAIFADQRRLIARHVAPQVEQVPQAFCAYKEVLGLYRQGLQVPDDVTIIWPDDNFGYVRNFASDAERKRSGGFGVYYHLSYLGAPLSYLWLGTTPPALVWEEMTKAYAHGAQRIWIANVGDIKPGEIGTELFLRMAWDINAVTRETLPAFLPAWAAREFGAAHGAEIGSIMDQYYRLNFQRKPEHLQWWLPKEAPRRSIFNEAEADERLAAFARLRARVARVASVMPAALRDAYFELVDYPVWASALANERFFEGERGNAVAALAADTRLQQLTAHWNGDLAKGKWRHIMAMEPADEQWRSMRVAPWTMPATAAALAPSATAPDTALAFEAERYAGKRDMPAAAWQLIAGLGRSGEGAMTVLPSTAASVALERAASDAPRLDYPVTLPAAGEVTLRAYLLPAHPIAGGALRFAVALDDAAPQLVSLEDKDGGADWAQGVLNGARVATARLDVAAAGAHVLHVYGLDAGVVIDKVVIDNGTPAAGYLGTPARP
jgi:hypothetical protein